MDEEDVSQQQQIRVRFVGSGDAGTACGKAGVLAVPAVSGRDSLLSLVKHLGAADDGEYEFLIKDRLLQTSLKQHVEISGLSFEEVVVVEIIEATSEPSLENSAPSTDWISCLCAFGKDGVVAGMYDGSMTWGDGKVAHDDAAIKAVATFDDVVLSGGHDCRLMARNESDGAEIGVGIGHSSSIDSILASSRLIASGDFSGMLFVWPRPGASDPSQTRKAHAQCVSGLDWFGAGLCSSSWDGTVKSWDVERLDQISTSPNLGTVLTCLSTGGEDALDGSPVAVGGHDGHVRLIDHRTLKPIQPILKAHSQCVSAVAFDPLRSSTHLASAAQDGSAYVWDLRATKPLYALKLPTKYERLLALAWTRDGRSLYLGGNSARLHRFSVYD